MRRFSYPVLALLALFISSCSSSTEPDNNGKNNSGSSVGLNSTYSFVATQTDLSGTKLAPDQSFSMTVTGVNQTYQGRSGVTIFSYSANNSAEYYHFASNNKVGRYIPMVVLGAPAGHRWVDFPFGGGTSEVHVDTMVTISGTTVPVKIDIEMTYKGQETLTIAGEPLTTLKVETEESGDIDFAGGNTYTRTATYWYAPSIKQIVKQYVRTVGEGFLVGQPSIVESEVTGYTIK